MTQKKITQSTRRDLLKMSALAAAGIAIDGPGVYAEPVPPVAASVLFAPPARGFISEKPAKDWQHCLLTGNGTLGALVMGRPYEDTIYLSHAGLYLPTQDSPGYIEMATRLAEIRRLCLAGDYRGAGEQIPAARQQYGYTETRDPFIGAFSLEIKQPGVAPVRLQRATNFLTAEASITVQSGNGVSRRNTFASRSDNVIVFGIAGLGKQTATLSFNALPPANEAEQKFILEQIKVSEQGVKDGHLYFRALFAHCKPCNPHIGYEGVGRVVVRGGARTDESTGIQIVDADEVIVLIEIRPLLQTDTTETAFTPIVQRLAALPADYAVLQGRHEKVHSELMTRVSLSLSAPAADRGKTAERLNQDALTEEAPLAKIERAFDAGRYNILCCTGYNPPNLQGLWSGTWRAPWSGDFTENGNLPCAVSFLMMGNTPELMEPYFRLHNRNITGFRENAKAFYGMRGFRIPCHITTSSRETDFSANFPANYGQGGAPWLMANYFDYFRYTGDRKFLEHVAYPLMKEACAYFEDYLSLTDSSGRVIFVPSYSPENAPGPSKNPPTCINATMDIACARQLLTNSIAAAKLLGKDAALQAKWACLIEKMPEYQAGPDGSFREWLWPGLAEHNEHRHASHLYALFDGRPQEIVGNPALVAAVTHSIKERLKFRETNTGMAFGAVQLGLAATHVGNRDLSQQIINSLARGYWSDGMASFHNWLNLFNMDISGGFPYLCVSSLVYAEPGKVQLFPARPEQWPSGSLRGVRLRGGIVLKSLTWQGSAAKATLVSSSAQTVTIEAPGVQPSSHVLKPGKDFYFDMYSSPQPSRGQG